MGDAATDGRTACRQHPQHVVAALARLAETGKPLSDGKGRHYLAVWEAQPLAVQMPQRDVVNDRGWKREFENAQL